MADNPIAVLGAGSWGTALAILLAKNQQSVRLWAHRPDHVHEMMRAHSNARYLPGIPFPPDLKLFDQLADALLGVRDVVIVVPSQAFADILRQIKPYLSPEARLIWGVKGLDPSTEKLLHQVAIDILGEHHPLAVLSGPSFAKEVALGLPTAVTIAVKDNEFARDLVARFNNNYFRVYTSEDIVGVEICGIVKNVLAVAAGIIDGLQLGSNALSALITRGLAEMMRLGLAMGAQPMTFTGLAGVGDLVLTCSSNQSRNRRFGAAIAAGKNKEQALKELGQVVEGLDNLKGAYHLAKTFKVEMPIVEQVFRVVYEGVTPQAAIRELLLRDPKKETN